MTPAAPAPVTVPRIAGRAVPALDTRSDHYLGVIYLANDFRVAISPGGRAYLCQSRDAGGVWSGRAVPERQLLCRLDLPDDEAREAVALLPDLPEGHFLAASISNLHAFARGCQSRLAHPPAAQSEGVSSDA